MEGLSEQNRGRCCSAVVSPGAQTGIRVEQNEQLQLEQVNLQLSHPRQWRKGYTASGKIELLQHNQ